MTNNPSEYELEILIISSEGRHLLGIFSAMNPALHVAILHRLSMSDISQEWYDEIESARLEKLRDMESRDDDSSNFYKDSDKMLKKLLNISLSHNNDSDLIYDNISNS